MRWCWLAIEQWAKYSTACDDATGDSAADDCQPLRWLISSKLEFRQVADALGEAGSQVFGIDPLKAEEVVDIEVNLRTLLGGEDDWFTKGASESRFVVDATPYAVFPVREVRDDEARLADFSLCLIVNPVGRLSLTDALRVVTSFNDSRFNGIHIDLFHLIAEPHRDEDLV